MEFYQREFLLSRLICGYLELPLVGSEVYLYPPSIDVKYKANKVYHEVYNDKVYDCLTDGDIFNLLIARGVWSTERESQLNDILPKHIEHWKVELYKAVLTSQKDTFRKYLQAAKNEQNRLYNIRHAYDYCTIDGIANYSKLQYIVQNSTKYVDGRPYDWKDCSVTLVVDFYYKSMLAETELRELARTEPWHSIWASSSKDSSVFNKAAIDLTDEQKRLIMWSSLYDNINDSTEKPDDSIVEDDDCLDGWLIVQKRNRDAEKKNQGKADSSKFGNATEVFLPSKSRDPNTGLIIDNRPEINAMNDSQAKFIKEQRFNQIAKHGEVTESNLADVKRELLIKSNQAHMDKMKGK